MKGSLKKFQLDGKVALVTGAAGLLGLEHCEALLEAGAKVVLTDNQETKLHKAKERLMKRFEKDQILTQPLDVSDINSIKTVGSWLQTNSALPSILINNAAIDPKVNGDNRGEAFSRLEYFPIDQWQLQLNVGLTGAFLCSQYFGNAMATSGSGGVILNIASDLSVISPDQRLYRVEGVEDELQPVKPVTYSVIKAGLVGLTRYLATYWADKGVRSNSLSPGGVFADQPDVFVNRLTNLIPMGRMAEKDEYRCAVQFLCSDASAYLNGQNIVMDGGRSIL